MNKTIKEIKEIKALLHEADTKLCNLDNESIGDISYRLSYAHIKPLQDALTSFRGILENPMPEVLVPIP